MRAAAGLSILSIVLVVAGLPGVIAAETLAQAAEREAARRQQKKKQTSAPAYSEASLAEPATGGTYTVLSGPVASPAGPPAATVPEPPRDGPRPDGRALGEDSWRQRAAELHQRIRALTEEVRAREKQLGGMAVRKLSCPDGGSNCWNPQMTHASPGRALRMARENLAQAQRELADLEDLARRNSIPPGWLRER